MRIGYLECFAGISGDMLLGALVDAGVARSLLEETARVLDIGAELRFSSVIRSGVSATKVDVVDAGGEVIEKTQTHSHGHIHHTHEHSHTHRHEHEHHHDDQKHEHAHAHGRSWKQICELIEHAPLAADVRVLALRAFEHLARAEAKIHSVPVDTVHFHEVGSVDAITDIVCGAAGLVSLGVDAWYTSAVNVGSGFVQCAHGLFPVPAPATAELLKGVPTYSTGIQQELTTPTGAALLKALECRFTTPAIATDVIGYGAGTHNPKDFPNVLRLSLGETVSSQKSSSERVPVLERITVLECAVDDMTPQVLAYTMERALEEGALDVMCLPAVMKKSRMGSLLTVLCRPERREALEELLLRETTTLGIRVREEERAILQRRFLEVETAYGNIRVKIGSHEDEDVNWMPEYDDCVRAAREHGVPLKQVMQAALVAVAEKRVEA